MKIKLLGTVLAVSNTTLSNGAITSKILLKRPDFKDEFGDKIAEGKIYEIQSYSEGVTDKLILEDTYKNKKVVIEAWLDSNEVDRKEGTGKMYILNLNLKTIALYEKS